MSAKKAQALVLPEIFYDLSTDKFFLKANPQIYLRLSEGDVKAHYQMAGYVEADIKTNSGLTNMKEIIVKTQLEKWVEYSGALAGFKCGAYEIGGRRVLVTSQASLIVPKKGPFPGIERFLEQLFEEEQLLFVLYWLKVALSSLVRGKFQPGQLLAMAGPPQCGKSFMHVLITMLLGGRAAKPYRYMTGQTTFNRDLVAAEHLIIEDENARSNTAARREFGVQIKDWTVNESISVHSKGRDALMLPSYRRLSLSVNWETEYLMILPPMDNSIMDKVMLFKCSVAKLSADREKNIEMLKNELPAFAYYLGLLKIPERLRDDRFGVKAYHNPEILEVLSDISPENRLAELIDQVLFNKTNLPFWRGTATELEQELSSSAFRYSVEKLLPYASACGTFLARLATKDPDRYEQRKNLGRTIWAINPPKGKIIT